MAFEEGRGPSEQSGKSIEHKEAHRVGKPVKED
jgi:hypothetical protein